MQIELKGIIPPVITPLLNNNELDVKGLENLIEHLISGGSLFQKLANLQIKEFLFW